MPTLMTLTYSVARAPDISEESKKSAELIFIPKAEDRQGAWT
ncbi:TPA: hypothetical protein ACF9EM_000594 [Legionella pneumophila]|nr:hypothetical protein [Legionella pneumophila]